MSKRILIALFAALVLVGCGRNKPEEPEQSPLSLLYQEAQELMSQDNADGAITLLDGALSKEEFADYRGEIFRAMLSLLFEQQQYEDAVKRHLAMAAESAPDAEPSCRMIEQALSHLGNDQLLLDWSTALLDVAFSDPTRCQIYITHACALVKNNRADEALALIPMCRDTMSDSMCARIYSGMINSYIGLKRPDTAYAAIDKVESIAGKTPELLELAVVSRLDLYGRESKWDSFMMLFGDKVNFLTDSALSSALNTSVSRMCSTDKSDLAQQICSLVIDKRTAKEKCFSTAARNWLRLGTESQPEASPDKVRILIDKGFTGDTLLRMIGKPYYKLVELDKAKQLKQMMALIKEFLPTITSERDITTARSMLLDGSFILNDYETAIAMIQEGIEGRDENWHAMALVKLKAHQALDAGKTDDAVKYFREFMTLIAETMDREVDPSTGMSYTVNWCLGRNAKRIGDIQKEAGNTSQAKSAYLEAKTHFDKALGDFKPKDPEHAAITEEMKLLPASI